MHEVEVNVYYKSYVERMKIDICNLGRTEVILGISQLTAHNPEINQEIEKVKMMRCLPFCGKVKGKREAKKKRERRVVTVEEEKIVKQAIDNKEDQGKKEEIEKDHRKIEEMVPEKFLKQRKVFGKVELERMLIRKVQDHAINLKDTFVL